MKKLHLLRHAKSSRDNSYLADIDRPLNERGIRDCQVMAVPIVEAGCPLTTIFCSPAMRAQSTIEYISEALADREITWRVDSALYTFEFRDLLKWCQELDDTMTDVVIIGHNPAMTDFANQMSSQMSSQMNSQVSDRTNTTYPAHTIENLPTCGYAQLLFQDQSWQTLSVGSAELVSFLKPKMFVD